MSFIDIPSTEEIAASKSTVDTKLDYLLNRGIDEQEIANMMGIPYHMVFIMKKKYPIDKNVLFSQLVSHYENIASMSSVKGKRTEAEIYLKKFPISYEKRIRFLLGEISDEAYSVGEETILESLRLAKDKTVSEMNNLIASYGEVGEIAVLLSDDKPSNLLLDEVYFTLKELPHLGRTKAILAVSSLFKKTNKTEAKYLSRLLRKRLYLHLPIQTVTNLVSTMYSINLELLTNTILVKGEVAGLLLARNGLKALQAVQIRPGIFVPPQLAYRYDKRNIVFPSLAEVKYDGWRCELHKRGNDVIIFSRSGKPMNLEFPSIVQLCKDKIKGTSTILDGEIVGYKDSKVVTLYKMVEDKTNVSIRFFDVLYNDKPTIGLDLLQRKEILYSIVTQDLVGKFYVCKDHDELMKHYDRIVAEGNEGIVVKDLTSLYMPNKRSYVWSKLKKARDTLDVVITKAKYGSGYRGGQYTGFSVSVRDSKEKKLYNIGDVANLDQDTAEYLMPKINNLVTSKDKEGVFIKPSIVIEISVFDILKSKENLSGYSLRNPYYIRERTDKKVSDIDTIDRVIELSKVDKDEERN